MKQKHVTDIWHLVHSIRSNTLVPRTLLRNGKRSRAEPSSSQAHHQRDVNDTTNISAQPSCNNDATQILQGHDSADSNSLPQRSTTNENSTTRHNDDTFCSIVTNDIGNLKASVLDLKREVQELKGKVSSETRTRDECSCYLIYLRLKNKTSEKLDKTLIEAKLWTSILEYEIIRRSPTPVFRVKI